MIITGTDFRTNQSKYIGVAYRGEDVVVKARAGCFKVVPVDIFNDADAQRDIKADLTGAFKEVMEHMQGKRKLRTATELLDELRNTRN
ncbi:MAG: prevent-host-death family protein [Prevotella sp.]|nr:prevent-host-death family protein [Prevotella sp.]